MAQERQRREAMEVTEETTTDPAVLAAGASVVLSWYYFFVRGERERGMFVGLWPPTILAFASYFRQKRMSDRLEETLGGGTRLAESIQRMMQGR